MKTYEIRGLPGCLRRDAWWLDPQDQPPAKQGQRPDDPPQPSPAVAEVPLS